MYTITLTRKRDCLAVTLTVRSVDLPFYIDMANRHKIAITIVHNGDAYREYMAEYYKGCAID